MEDARNLSTLVNVFGEFSGPQISLWGLWTIPRRGVGMLRGLGNTDWKSTHAISRPVTKEELTTANRLVICH